MDIVDGLLDGSCGEPSAVMRLVLGLTTVPEPPVFISQKSCADIKQAHLREPDSTAKPACSQIAEEPQLADQARHAVKTVSNMSSETSNLTDDLDKSKDTSADSVHQDNDAQLQDMFMRIADGNAGLLHSSMMYALGVQHGAETLFEYFKNAALGVETYEAVEEEHEHGDDCTPSCGPNFLMEIQNPTWETVVYNNYASTMQVLHEHSTEVSKAIQQFHTSFIETVTENQLAYEYSLVENLADGGSLDDAVRLVREGKFLEAVPHLESVLKTDGASTEGWMLLALSTYMCQNDARCVSACRCYVRQETTDVVSNNFVLLLMATCLANESDFLAAQAVIFEYLTSNFDVTDACHLQLCKAGNNVEGLVSLLEKTLETSPTDGPLHWALAILHFGLENFSTAGRNFEAALKQNPTSPCVINQIGACLQNMQRYEEALELQNRALSICPGFFRALYNKAVTESSMGNSETALQTIASTIENLDRVVPDYTDQFWHLAARIAPRLANKTNQEHSSRLKIMSAVLERNLHEFRKLLTQ